MVGEQDLTFGSRLRRLREATSLTQEELALRAGLSPRAISALERGERQRPYPHTVRMLADALELSEEERVSLLATLPRRGGAAPAPLAATPEFNLPVPPTPLLGRERELEQIRISLREVKLLTFTGLGGVGKTRLALEAARDAAENFPDGVAFVGLASLADPALVVATVARSVGLREAGGQSSHEVLLAYLREKRLLLVLDNFEHLMEAAPEVSGLLGSCPDLTVLATSRAPLRLRGEREYPVPSLEVPDSSRVPEVEEIIDAPAVRLFVERAQEASTTFKLTEANAAAVAAICWRLDGLPLALELAAAKTRFLGPIELLSRLNHALVAGAARDLPERQRTMRATMDWSYELLHGPEKKLFRRLSVFAGGFTLEAAEAVGAERGATEVSADEDVLLLLGNLVEQSLVVAEPGEDEGTRYRMLESVRQYAREKLEESGQAQEVRRRHATLFLALAEEAEPELRGAQQVLWTRRLEKEQDNLRSAMSWALSVGEDDTVVRLGWALYHFWWYRGHQREGRRWMEEALSRSAAMAASARARALFVAGTMASVQADFRSAKPLLEESLSLFRQLKDKQGTALALGASGLVALDLKQHERGIIYFQEAADLFLEVGDKWRAAVVFSFLAVARLDQGDHSRAKRLAERGLALSQEVGHRRGTSTILYVLARLAQAERDREQASRLFEEGLTLSAEVGDKTNVAYCLEGLAAIAASEDRLVCAARLWGAAEALLETIEVKVVPYAPERSLYQGQVAAARPRLDEQAWLEAWAEGRAMSFEQAVEYALSAEKVPPT